MRLFVLSLFGALTCSTAAIACPALNMSQGATTFGMDQLGAPQSVSLTAGGENQLDQCGLGMLGFGQFRSAPDYSFVVSGGAAQDVVLAVTSECDATMLVNTADGQWHFNDDANGNLDPRLVVPAGAALDGQVDVWLGTFNGGECAATLNIAQAGVEMPVAPPMAVEQPSGDALALVTPPPAMPSFPAPVIPTPEAPVQTQTPQPVPVQPVPAPQFVPAPQPVVPPPQPVPAPQAIVPPQPVPVPAPIPVPPPAPVPAAVCPNPNIVGPSLTLTGGQLMSPQAYVAQVGGQHEVSNCAGIDGWGYANEAPSFTLFMSQMNGYTFSAETTTECDPTLIIRDAYGQWYFNDDGPNGLQPRLEIDGNSLNGRVDIWVGAFGNSACQGTITFRTVSAAPAPQPPVTPVGGCPNPGMQGIPVQTTGQALYSPTDYALVAGGPTDLSTCGLPVSGWGWFSAQPSYSFFLSGMQEYGRLEIEGESTCDTVMLVRTPNGSWYFDDDSNGNLNPLINLTDTFGLNGRLDVWMGSYNGTTCNASIELETWYN